MPDVAHWADWSLATSWRRSKTEVNVLACLRRQTELEDDVRAYGRGKSGLVERHFVLSLVQTSEGLPIAHEVHAGNTAEAKTLLPMVRGLLARYPLKRVALVADRGEVLGSVWAISKRLPSCRRPIHAKQGLALWHRLQSS